MPSSLASDFTKCYLEFMKYIILLIILLFSVLSASAQSITETDDTGVIVNLGNGIFLETISPKYITSLEDPPDYIKNGVEEWVVIPATFETITETVVVEDAHSELKVTPAIIADDGSIRQPAAASLIEMPAVTRVVKHRVVKTPSRVEKRVVPYLYTPPTVRKKVSEAIFIFRDQLGVEIKRFENPADAMRYIEGLPN